MGQHPLSAVMNHLRREALERPGESASDGQLLDRFLRMRDEDAFELLVWRHARLVLGVCRRVLEREADAEDAFQATFLVLVRQARSLRRGDSLASWLARIAYRVALRARSGRRDGPNLTGVDPPAPDADPSVSAAWRELQALLDEELDLLPEKYRVPLVLCHLEGKTHDEAAKEMGCPRGTVAVRLMRGRELLRGRLLRRGVALSAGLLIAGTATKVSATLVNETVKAGTLFATAHAVSTATVALAEGVLRSMFLNKLKTTLAGVLLAATVMVGLGLGLQKQETIQAQAPKDPEPPGVAERKLPPDPPPPLPKPEAAPTWKGLLADSESLALDFEMLQGERSYKGTVMYLKPDRVFVKVRQGNEEPVEHLIADSEMTVTLLPQSKTAVRSRPPHGPLPVSFVLFGFDPAQAWRRFEITIAKQDQYYHYLNILPVTPEDKKLFVLARLVVNRETMMARQLWVEHPEGRTVTWDVVRAAKDPSLKAEDFRIPDLTGWKIVDRPENPAKPPVDPNLPPKALGPMKVESVGGQVHIRCDLFEATADSFIKDGDQFQFSGKVRLSVKGKPGEAPTQITAEKVIWYANGQLKVEGVGKLSGN